MRTSKYQVLDNIHAMSPEKIRERPHRPHVMYELSSSLALREQYTVPESWQ